MLRCVIWIAKKCHWQKPWARHTCIKPDIQNEFETINSLTYLLLSNERVREIHQHTNRDPALQVKSSQVKSSLFRQGGPFSTRLVSIGIKTCLQNPWYEQRVKRSLKLVESSSKETLMSHEVSVWAWEEINKQKSILFKKEARGQFPTTPSCYTVHQYQRWTLSH